MNPSLPRLPSLCYLWHRLWSALGHQSFEVSLLGFRTTAHENLVVDSMFSCEYSPWTTLESDRTWILVHSTNLRWQDALQRKEQTRDKNRRPTNTAVLSMCIYTQHLCLDEFRPLSAVIEPQKSWTENVRQRTCTVITRKCKSVLRSMTTTGLRYPLRRPGLNFEPSEYRW